MLTVACCLWGSWPEPGWGPEYVARLQRGVARNLNVPHRFVCFADDPERVPEGIEARPLNAPSWKGCLPKLYVYSPEAGLEGRVLLFDLDNVIVGDLSDMAAYDGPLAVRAWFGGYDNGVREADGDMIGFDAHEARPIWDALVSDVRGAERWTGGRERYFLREVCSPALWQDILGPGRILSYKRHLRGGKPLPETATVVSFHDKGKAGGTCRPHQLDIDWLERHWT